MSFFLKLFYSAYAIRLKCWGVTKIYANVRHRITGGEPRKSGVYTTIKYAVITTLCCDQKHQVDQALTSWQGALRHSVVADSSLVWC